MKENNQLDGNSNEPQSLFKKIDDNTFCIQADCIFTEDKILKLGEVYELTTFLDNAGINLRYIKLMAVFEHAKIMCIIGIDIQTGEVIKRFQNINVHETSSWLIVELFYLNKSYEEKVNTLCQRIQQRIDHELQNLSTSI